MRIRPLLGSLAALLFACFHSHMAAAATSTGAGPSGIESVRAVSLLDQVGSLDQPIPENRKREWQSELALPTLSKQREAQLRIWLGENALAESQDVQGAILQFMQAAHAALPESGLCALAKYDLAIADFDRGAYSDSASEFRDVESHTYESPGVDRNACALWLRHAEACTGYHAERAQEGIPEPPVLDPNCGAAALASSLRSLNLPWTKTAVLAHCKVTGRGSSSLDLQIAGRSLGVNVYSIRCDDMGLKLAPKPLIAHVEHDHFISVIAADDKGVSYLCSDCGAWPGGRVNLSWRQWQALECDTCYAVTLPKTVWDTTLKSIASVGKSTGETTGKNVVSALTLPHITLSAAIRNAQLLKALIGSHIISYVGDSGYCTTNITTLHCPPWQTCPTGSNNPGCAGTNDPVNLATGEEEYSSEPDIRVYNSHGPSVSWGRSYGSLRPASYNSSLLYNFYDFGYGWTQPYNAYMYDPTPSAPLYYYYQMAAGGAPPTRADSSDAPVSGDSWDIVPIVGGVAGSPIAYATPNDSSHANGWNVTYNSPFYYIQSPPAATSGYYEARYQSAYFGGFSVHVYVAATGTPYQIPAAATNITSWPNGNTDVCASGLAWDILCGGTTIATSKMPNGWKSRLDLGGAVVLNVPLKAPISTGYEYRDIYGNDLFFSVLANQEQPQAGRKYFIYPNGGRVPVTAPSVPTVSSPDVTCSVPNGVPLAVAWNYDSSSPFGHFTITFKDRTQFVTSTPQTSVSAFGYGDSVQYTVYYPLAKIADVVGNSIALNYNTSYVTPEGFPLLSSISDPVSGTNLLSITRDIDAGISSNLNVYKVTDKDGRCVYYHDSAYGQDTNNNYLPFNDVDYASQILPSGSANPYPSQARNSYGYTTRTSYTSAPFLSSISVPSPVGTGTSTATITYDSSDNFVSSTQDANGNILTYTTPDSAHTTVTTTNASSPGTNVDQYTVLFSTLMNETARTDGNGAYLDAMTYSDANDPYLPSQVLDGKGATNGGLTGATNYSYDRFGNVVATTSPRSVTTTFTYDTTYAPLGQLTAVQEGTKTPTTYSYGASAGSTNCHLLQAVYGPLPGDVGLSATSAHLLSWYTYDALGNYTTVQTLGPNSTAATYGSSPGTNYTTASYIYPAGALEAIGEPSSVTISGSNSGSGSESATTSYTYDSHGNVTSVTDPNSNTTYFGDTSRAYGYNLADQPIRVTFPATGQSGTGNAYSTNSYAYPGGPLTGSALYDESGSLSRSNAFGYGAEGEHTSSAVVYSPPGGSNVMIENMAYDAAYRPTSVTQHKTSTDAGQTTTYAYYPPGVAYAGRLKSVTYPKGEYTLYGSYDADSNVLQRQVYTSTGSVVSGYEADYTYSDPESLLTAITYPSATSLNVAYGYDSYGRVVSASDGAAPGYSSGGTAYPGYTFGYDDRDDTTSATTAYSGMTTAGAQTVLSLGYAYKPDGSRASVTLPTMSGSSTSTNSYTYDGLGRLTKLVNPYSNALSWTYQANGWPLTQTDKNNASTTDLITSLAYNARGFLTDLQQSLPLSAANNCEFGSATSSTNAMHYDAAGNRTSIPNITAPTIQSGAWADSYSYDGRDELLSESVGLSSGAVSNSFAYDVAGNPTTFRSSSGITYNADDQVINTAFVFDAAGDPTTYKNKGLAFDPQCRMTTYNTSTPALTAAYTAGGLRAWKADSTGTRTYTLYDGGNPVCELDSTGTVIAANTFGALGFASRKVASGGLGAGFYAFDASGNTVLRINGATGAVTASYLYDAYGNAVAGSSTTTAGPFGYGGEWGYVTDAETGLTLCGHRYYDAVKGRWLNRDPIGYAGGLDLYGYVGNGPVGHADGSGLYATGSYWGDVGQVFVGYSDLVNPVVIGDSVAGLARIAGECGGKAAAGAFLDGLGHSYTDWLNTGDPRTFGRSFGTVLATVGAAGAGGAGDGLGGAPKPPIENDPAASTPVGRRGSPIEVEPGTNEPATVNGIDFSGHALDRMQGRGIMPSMVEEVIQNGTRSPSYNGSTVFSSQGVSVVVSTSGRIITVMHGKE